MTVEDENEDVVFKMDTSAGMDDFEENIVRKAEYAMREHESQKALESALEEDD